MHSPLACVGLAVSSEDELGRLVALASRRGSTLGSRGAFSVVRWQDPGGARLVLLKSGGRVADVNPSFAALRSTRLRQLTEMGGNLSMATVVDADGVETTRLAVEMEEFELLRRLTADRDVGLSALGLDLTLHEDAEAFAASPASLMTPSWLPRCGRRRRQARHSTSFRCDRSGWRYRSAHPQRLSR